MKLSLKLKLTLWYSSFVLVFCIIFVIGANVLMTEQIKEAPAPLPRFLQNKPRAEVIWKELTEEKKDLIQSYREQDLQNFRRTSILTLIPLSLLSFGGGYIIADKSLSPLKKLNKQIAEINSINLNKQIEHEDNEDEISALIKNFNSMTARLHKSFEAQRQFVEDASHELKTPLAIIQANLDAATIDKKITTKEMQKLIETAQNSSKFMNELIEDLLLLSIVENKLDKEETDLGGILSSAITSCKALAEEKDISIKYQNPQHIIYKANTILFQRAISNVLENAIKYSPPKSTVTIESKIENEKYKISISDEGEGIPATERKKIFERFYRVDKSRSRATGGSGLGLSIVKKIIEAHEGTIRIEANKPKGTKVIIALPITSKPVASSK